MTIVKGLKSTLGNRVIFGLKRPPDSKKKSQKPTSLRQINMEVEEFQKPGGQLDQEVWEQMSGSATMEELEDSKS